MSPSARASIAVKVLLLGTPLLIPLLVPIEVLPAGLGYALNGGRWLIGLAVLATFVTVQIPQSTSGQRWGYLPSKALPLLGRGAGFVAVLFLVILAGLLIPSSRWGATRFSGDEPKYVRMAVSLHADLDVDMESESTDPATFEKWSRNLRWLRLTTRDAIVDLFSDRREPAPEHEWNLGNWRVAGLQGGRYYVHSPGLPLLLLPSMLLQDVLAPGHPHTLFPQLTLVLLWALATSQTIRLASEVSRSRLAGIGAGLAFSFSTPVFLASYHFYPEVAAMAAVPWIVRKLRAAAPQPSALEWVVVSLVIGALPWLHAKFTAVSAALVLLLVAKLKGRRLELGGAVALIAVPLFALLLFDHHITGLFRPDALYQRYESDVYSGLGSFFSLRFVRGLAIGLFGALDGLFVMAPVAIAACLALPLAWRRSRRNVLELGLVFASLWLAAAVHGGGAPGPPARLMAPVAGLLAAPLAVGFVERGRYLPFRWSAVALILITGVITWTMLDDWRRPVKPYREMFPSAAVDFSRDLPGGSEEKQSEQARAVRDVGGSVVLALAIGFWAWRLTRHVTASTARDRPRESTPIWPLARDTHLGWWATLIALSVILSTLSP
jgi:hypothetical protein